LRFSVSGWNRLKTGAKLGGDVAGPVVERLGRVDEVPDAELDVGQAGGGAGGCSAGRTRQGDGQATRELRTRL
jgi:hypothetical protein